jgi:hypothetical protein
MAYMAATHAERELAALAVIVWMSLGAVVAWFRRLTRRRP